MHQQNKEKIVFLKVCLGFQLSWQTGFLLLASRFHALKFVQTETHMLEEFRQSGSHVQAMDHMELHEVWMDLILGLGKLADEVVMVTYEVESSQKLKWPHLPRS